MRRLVFWMLTFLGFACAVVFVPAVHSFYVRWTTFTPVLSGPDGYAVELLFRLFLWPVALCLNLVWTQLLGLNGDVLFRKPVGYATMPLLCWFAWMFWVTVISRYEKFFGVWDPFAAWTFGIGGWVLRRLIGVREWWEALTRFGRGPTAGWAGLFEVLSRRWKWGQIFLGRPKLFIGGLLRPVGLATEKHMVTIAGTGSGKSTGALIPNICIHPGAMLCIDPKGELAAITARRRGRGGHGVKGMGDAVYVLDPFGIVPGWQSASYNVFDEMEQVAAQDPERPVSYAGKIAEALVTHGNKRDPYWDNAAQTLLHGLILYVFSQRPKEKHNLVEVRRLLMEGDAEGLRQALDAGIINERDGLSAFDVLLEKMKTCPEGPYRDMVAGAAGSILKMGPNQLGSVVSTAQEHTAFLDIPQIRRISGSSDFLLEYLKTNAISVYLCLPINAVSGKEGRWLRMFVLLFIDMMIRVNKAPKPPVLLAIDEFPSLGKLEGIEVVAPVLRSYGVRFWAVGQDIEQFKATYPESWGGFIGGAEAVQFMGITHPETVDFIVKQLGEHVTGKRVREGGALRNVEHVNPLLDRDQVSRLLAKERNNQIVWRGSHRPMLLKTTPYFEYMPCWYYDSDGRYREKWNRRIWRWGFKGKGPLGPPPRVASAPAPAPVFTPAPPRAPLTPEPPAPARFPFPAPAPPVSEPVAAPRPPVFTAAPSPPDPPAAPLPSLPVEPPLPDDLDFGSPTGRREERGTPGAKAGAGAYSWSEMVARLRAEKEAAQPEENAGGKSWADRIEPSGLREAPKPLEDALADEIMEQYGPGGKKPAPPEGSGGDEDL